MTSPLQIVPQVPPRPADLIRVAVPRLNKCDWVSEYLKQLEERDYDIQWARVIEIKVLNCADWNALMGSLLEDRDWLAGKGGTASWAFNSPSDENEEDDGRDSWLKFTEAERELFRRTSYLLVVAVKCAGQVIYIDPEGYNYARYVAFAADALPEGKTREELRREAQDRELTERAAELAKRITTPPEVPADHGLRFLWNGIKHNNGELIKCHYSLGKPLGLKNVSYPEETITVYANDKYSGRFPAEICRCFHIENATDSQSDYFDDDKFRVCPNHPLYQQVRAAFEAAKIHDEKRSAKRMERRGY